MMFYSAGSQRLVLVPSKSSALPILFEARDPEQALDRLTRALRVR